MVAGATSASTSERLAALGEEIAEFQQLIILQKSVARTRRRSK